MREHGVAHAKYVEEMANSKVFLPIYNLKMILGLRHGFCRGGRSLRVAVTGRNSSRSPDGQKYISENIKYISVKRLKIYQ
jgi:hypothetical protein